MYGKVLVASGSAYLLAFEHDVLPPLAGTVVLLVSGVVVAFDVCVDGPQHRLEFFVQRCSQRLTGRLAWCESRAERAAEVRAAAREELRMNHGIRMAEELTDEDRQWLREQAELTLKHYR